MIAALLALACVAWAPSARAALTPEVEALRLSKRLKPIPDSEWTTIAGAKTSEKYEVVIGDTLWDISKRLFGDARYWPKIWALNNENITNPHVLRPGKEIAFMPGTGSTLPAVEVEPPPPPKPEPPKKSQEWKDLPRQRWEQVPIALPPEVDKHGFDRGSVIRFAKGTTLDLEALAASERVTYLGQITGSRSEANYLTLGDTVYIRADEEIQVGESYAITSEPEVLKARSSDRVGYSYLVRGKVKIIGVKDSLFIGTILTNKHFISRGMSIMVMPAPIPDLTPIPGPRPLEGTLMLDKNLATYVVAQHKQVFVDRGSDDGVQQGMVFRAYQHYDPSNERKITDSDFIIDADILMMQVSERFSTGLIINSLSMVTENSFVVLLTDISDLLSTRGFRERSTEEKQRDDELDDLDKLDTGGGLGKDEERELMQLEKWKENPPGTQDAAPPPAEEATPPPSPEGASELPPPPATEELPPPPSGGDELPPLPGGDELPPPPPEE